MLGKVLITGGLGNLGQWVTKEFYLKGYDVFVLTRKESSKIEGIKYSVIDPLNIIIDTKFHMGRAKGVFDISTMTLKLNIEVSKRFKSKYSSIVSKLNFIEKTKDGYRYSYEYKL